MIPDPKFEIAVEYLRLSMGHGVRLLIESKAEGEYEELFLQDFGK